MLRTVHLALEILTGVCATLPEPEVVEGEEEVHHLRRGTQMLCARVSQVDDRHYGGENIPLSRKG